MYNFFSNKPSSQLRCPKHSYWKSVINLVMENIRKKNTDK